jgi:hypothetical protein
MPCLFRTKNENCEFKDVCENKCNQKNGKGEIKEVCV